jgi:hypothetical protein
VLVDFRCRCSLSAGRELSTFRSNQLTERAFLNTLKTCTFFQQPLLATKAEILIFHTCHFDSSV